MTQTQQQDHFKAKAKKLPTSAGKLTAEQRKMVDELAELRAELEPLRAKIDKAEELRKALVPLADMHFLASQQAVLKGDKHTVTFSAAGEQRYIKDMNALIGLIKAKIGLEGLLKVIKLTMGDIDKLLTATEREPYIGKGPGPRKLQSHD